MTKATHTGECQICGSRQKAPAGLVAKHGYVVAGYGFFNGVCPGSGRKPYEVSCDAIEGVIERGIVHAAALRDHAEARRAPIAEGVSKAMVREYRPARFRGQHSGYEWREVEIEPGEHPRTAFYVDLAGKRKRLDVYPRGRVDTFRDLLAYLNGEYAAFLDKSAAEVDANVATWRQRVTDWKPRDLQPVAA